jgi:hypothetical protein
VTTSTTLKNPGSEPPTNLDFDTYPDPREFMRHGGRPGVSYLYVLSKNIATAQRKGWLQITGMPHFTVRGHSMTIMGKGRPSVSGSAGSSKPIFFIDPEAKEVTGLELGLDGKTKDNGKPQATKSNGGASGGTGGAPNVATHAPNTPPPAPLIHTRK